MQKANSTPEFLLITALALGLYLPFLSIQYDTNGIIEATGVESGPRLDKNHLLYRPVGLLAWKAFRAADYSGNSLLPLQIMTAVTAALGVGFAYLAFTVLTSNRAYAGLAALALGTSFTYWVCATDVFYLPMAGMFAAAALACVLRARSAAWIVSAGVLAALSILTWEAAVFLIPALLLLIPAQENKLRSAAIFTTTVVSLAALGYVAVAFGTRGFMGPGELWTWLTHYNETPSLSIWGAWHFDRIATTAVSVANSIVAIRLGAGLHELLGPVQWGRIAVDIAAVAFFAMLLLAVVKTRARELRFLAAYLCFMPFISWWDPGSHKWFLVPNIFLAAFMLTGLDKWRSRKNAGLGIAVCVLAIAASNFITTIRPRHFNPGAERPLAECVAAHMQPKDLFIAAEWGWPDYLQYLHNRSALNLINETAEFGDKDRALKDVRDHIDVIQRDGGTVYASNPGDYSPAQLEWLEGTTGLALEDLSAFKGSPAFVCSGKTIHRL